MPRGSRNLTCWRRVAVRTHIQADRGSLSGWPADFPHMPAGVPLTRRNPAQPIDGGKGARRQARRAAPFFRGPMDQARLSQSTSRHPAPGSSSFRTPMRSSSRSAWRDRSAQPPWRAPARAPARSSRRHCVWALGTPCVGAGNRAALRKHCPQRRAAEQLPHDLEESVRGVALLGTIRGMIRGAVR